MQAPCHARRLFIWWAFAGGQAFSGGYERCILMQRRTLAVRSSTVRVRVGGHRSDALHEIKGCFVRAHTHEERGFERRTAYCTQSHSARALKPTSSGLDIAYVWLCAATMSGAWISQSY